MAASYRRLRLISSLFCVLLIAGTWLAATFYIDQMREALRSDAGRQIRQTAQAFATTAKLSFEIADQALQRLQYTATYTGLKEFIQEAQLLTNPAMGSTLNRASWIGADGIMRANYYDGVGAPLLDVRDREYFQTFAADPSNRIFVTEPIKGKASGKWIILFARPLLEGKHFRGVVFVGFETTSFQTLFKGVRHENLLVSLLSPGGHIIGRSLNEAALTGHPVDIRTLPNPEEIVDFTSPVDHIKRLSTSLQVPGWGMRVYTGYDLEAIEAASTGTKRSAYFAATLLTLALLLAWFLAQQAIDTREKAAIARRQEAQRSRQTLEGMMEGVAVLGADSTIQFINPTMSQWLGNEPGHPFMDTVTRAGLRLVTEDGQPSLMPDPVASLCLASGEVVHGLWLTEDSESRHWLKFQASPLADENGQVTGAIVTLSDYTDEHQRLNELAITQTIMTQMSDGVMIMDTEGRVTRANPAISRMSGYGAAELQGLSCFLLHSARHGTALRQEIMQALQGTGHWFGRVWQTRADGSEFCCSQSLSAVRDPQGNVIRYVAVWRDITQQDAHEQQLWRRANFDPLTHLANRQRFEDRLDHILAQAQRHQTTFAVVFMDMDYFKNVNDRLGHAAGDALLREAAQRMQNLVREGDTLARIGGDEFALIAPDISAAADAEAMVEKLVRALAAPFFLTEGEARISLSAGIALYPLNGTSSTCLLNAADRAVYEVKARGRNGFALASLPGTEVATSSKITPT